MYSDEEAKLMNEQYKETNIQYNKELIAAMKKFASGNMSTEDKRDLNKKLREEAEVKQQFKELITSQK